MEINVREAKSHPSKVKELARAKAGKPVIHLVPIDPPHKRVFGSAKDEITFKKGWDAAMTKRQIKEFLG